jgi:hypothetical protein
MLVQKELKNAYIWIPNPTSIVLDKSSISLTTIWQTEQLTATIEPTLSDHSVTWSSDDTTIATVSTTGLVTCVTPWTCTITATTVNGLTATCSVGIIQTISIDWTSLSALPSGYVSNWTYTFNNGFSVTNWDTCVWIPLDMSNLSKITIESNGNRTNTSRPWWDNIWITDWSWFKGGAWAYNSITWNKAYGSNASSNGIRYVDSSNNTNLTNFSTWSNQGNWNLKLEIDLTDWSVVFSSTAPYTFNDTADASAYLAEMKTYWYVYMGLYPANRVNSTIYSTTITYQ